MTRMTRSSEQRKTIRDQIKNRKANYAQKGRRAEVGKREKEKVSVAANDDMQEFKTSKIKNQKNTKGKAGLRPKGHVGKNRTQS